MLEIDRDKYQVFLVSSPAHLPVSFGIHPWFVINKKGQLSRWEILTRKNKFGEDWGHLHLDFVPPFRGLRILIFLKGWYWKSKTLGVIEGEKAKEIIELIESSPEKYPYCQKYLLTGPNSNTYAQWILNNFPEFDVGLPWNAFGKMSL